MDHMRMFGYSFSHPFRGGAKGGGLAPPNITSRKLCQNDYIFFFFFCNFNIKKLGALSTQLERCFQDLFKGILQAPNS